MDSLSNFAALPIQINQTQAPAGDPLSTVLNNLEKERQIASTNVLKASQGMVPQATTTTPRNFNINPTVPYQNAPLIEKETVGARSTRDKGIANTIIGAANFIGNFKAKRQENKNRALSVDIERVLQATDGIQSAQDTLKVDPNNQQAKDTLERNNKIINALLSDPKRQKAIAKALDINFTDPSQNKTNEHAAMQQAVRSYSEQLQSQLPKIMQVNPQAIQQYQVAEQQQKAVTDMVDKVMPAIIKEQGSRDLEEQKEKSKKEIVELTENFKKIIQEMKDKSSENVAETKANATVAAAKARANATIASANTRVAGTIKAIQMRIDAATKGIDLHDKLSTAKSGGFSATIDKDKKTALAAAQANLKNALNLQKQIPINIHQLEQIRNNADDAAKPFYDKAIQDAEKQAADIGDKIKAAQDKLQELQNGQSSFDRESSKSSKSSNSSSISRFTKAGPVEDTDSDKY